MDKARRFRSVFAAAIGAILLTACGSGDGGSNSAGNGIGGGGTACTAEARSSIVLSVVDPSNQPINAVTVLWQVDGAPLVQSQICDARCGLGFEQAGAFEITASKSGFVSQRVAVTVGVETDRCHVRTESRTLTLQPAF